MRIPPASRSCRSLVAAAVALLAACTTTGNSFDTADLRFLQPGVTTLPEAAQLLQADPVNVYRQADGSATARWAHSATLATDALYFNRELWLAFDAHGRYTRIVKANNVPHANLYQDGRRVDIPARPTYGHAAASPTPPPAGAAGVSAPSSPLPHAAVTYPLAQ